MVVKDTTGVITANFDPTTDMEGYFTFTVRVDDNVADYSDNECKFISSLLLTYALLMYF